MNSQEKARALTAGASRIVGFSRTPGTTPSWSSTGRAASMC